ncbi:Unconventional prefoldin RPB5 interactor [Caenorhabditis elegans]|uniref:Unconventional prefoldin RPB5 interactor n=1 Tax=Caenorhabditis elegans TaxID=6239 RepID=Q966M4_CAEEL|nr:Unconventional prefoldin RPB5 interactor [Caenorhabditis elegans]CCD68093.1 Unconventional prefoldin RPB5 interactor [Caenorhabditis elegans]|eukprot:NP_491870.1 URI (Unconventional prefoldin RPB5 Interactor) homolog [Caenorhabditis elegans]
MSELYVAECNAAKARLEVETECRRIIADNYEKVLERAKEYSKKLEAPILAKICEVGYFCGAHVVRTNQVTMEMGANYYGECSIHTAEKILDRRVSEMRRQREEGLDSIRMLDDKIKFAQDNFSSVSIDGGPIEIVEKYDEEMEKLFYQNRKNKKMSQNDEQNEKIIEKNKLNGDQDHNDVMNRLEELEKLEQDNDEMEEAPIPKPFEVSNEDLQDLGKLEEVEEVEQDPTDKKLRFGMNERLLAQPGVTQKEMERLLDFLDTCDEESSDEEYDEDEEEGDDDEENLNNSVEELDSDDYASDDNIEKSNNSDQQLKSKKIETQVIKVEEIVEETVTKTTVKRKKSGVRFAQQLENVKTFHQTDTVEIKEEDSVIETKSILRSTEPTPVDRSALEPEQKELAAMSTMTFPGEIVEKNPYECEPSTSRDPAPVITEKKVSKFRASRHRN